MCKYFKKWKRSRHTDISKLDILLFVSSFWVTALLELYHFHTPVHNKYINDCFRSLELDYVVNITHLLIGYSLFTVLFSFFSYITRITILLKYSRFNYIIYWFSVAIIGMMFTNYDFLAGFACIYFGTAIYLYKNNSEYDMYLSMRH